MLAETWVSMGLIRYPLGFATLVVVLLTMSCAAHLFSSGTSADLRAKTWIDAILFWGGFAWVTGVLGTQVGIIVAADSIEAAGQVTTSLLWGGIKVAMLSSAAGTLVLAFSGLAWFALQLRWRLLAADYGTDDF